MSGRIRGGSCPIAILGPRYRPEASEHYPRHPQASVCPNPDMNDVVHVIAHESSRVVSGTHGFALANRTVQVDVVFDDRAIVADPGAFAEAGAPGTWRVTCGRGFGERSPVRGQVSVGEGDQPDDEEHEEYSAHRRVEEAMTGCSDSPPGPRPTLHDHRVSDGKAPESPRHVGTFCCRSWSTWMKGGGHEVLSGLARPPSCRVPWCRSPERRLSSVCRGMRIAGRGRGRRGGIDSVERSRAYHEQRQAHSSGQSPCEDRPAAYVPGGDSITFWLCFDASWLIFELRRTAYRTMARQVSATRTSETSLMRS